MAKPLQEVVGANKAGDVIKVTFWGHNVGICGVLSKKGSVTTFGKVSPNWRF